MKKTILWVILLILAFLLPNAAQAAADTWVGNTSGNWGGANWTGGNNAPVNGDSLIFGCAGKAGVLLTNNLASLGVNNISINGPGAFTLGGNSLTLTNGLNDFAAVNETLRLSIGGPGGLTNSGTGTLTLSGANTYTGSTIISAGTLQIGDGNEATAGAGTGALAVGTNTLLLNFNGPATLSNSSVTSSGTIQNIGTGKVTFTNAATIGGVSVIYAGSAGLILATALTGDGFLAICGGDVTLSGNGYVSVGSFNTATTAHITNAGSFQQIGGFNPQGAMTLDIASGVTCSENIWQNGGTKYYNNLMGAGSFVFQGSTTAPGSYGYVLGNSTLGGTLVVGGSGLSFGNGGSGGLAGATTIIANSDVTFNSTSNNTYSGTMSGPGGLVKLGTNTLTLSGSNAYTGNITVNGGTLVLQQPSPFGNWTVTVSNGCVLRLNFVGTNQVAALVLNGVTQSPGVYNSATSPSYLAGTGSLRVTGAPPCPFVGNTNSPSYLPEEILAAYNAGYSNVTINPGTYVMANGPNTAVTLQNLQNFTINASNVVMTVGTGDCFYILNCTNVTIEGVTVRAQIYPFTQGRVTGIGTNNGTLFCNWQISAGYPTTNFQWWFNAVSASNQTINIQQGDIWCNNYFGTNSSGVASNAVYLGNQTWQMNFPGWSGFYFQTNDWLVARWGNQGHAYQLTYCSNCTLRNCTSQCGGFGTFMEGNSISDHILDCQIQPAPVPPPGGSELPVVANGVDGVHVVWDVVGPDIENFTATNVMLDDCIAIHGSYQRVAAVSGYNVTFNLHTLFPCGNSWDNAGFAVGQPVRISDTNGFIAQANCTAIQNLPDYQVITLDTELAIPIGALGSNPNADGSGYKIINCHLGNTRAHGIVAKTDNGLITGCTISGAGSGGMQFGPSYYWGEADYVWNVIVSNNITRNCGYAGIAVLSEGSVGNQNITIQNNIFENLVSSDGLSVSGCNGITISGNTFINPDAGYNPIYLDNSTNVTLLENLVTNAPAGTTLLEADASVTGINNQQNGIFLAGAYSFVNRLSNLVLNNPAGGGAGTQVTQQAGVTGNNSWILSPVGNGFCALVCASNGLALGVGGSTASNAPLVMETYTGSKSQLWALAPVTNFFVALTNALSGMAAQVPSSVAGQGLVQAPFNGSTSQQWYLDVLNLPIYTWDPQGTSGANPYLGSMSGTWENAAWSTSPTGQASPVGWSEGNNALFGVNTGTGTPGFIVTMNSGHTVAGIYNGSATTGPCTVTLNGNGTITNNNGMVFATTSLGSTTITNVIAGSGGITVEGSGVLKLSAPNTYTGATTISSPGAFPAAGYSLSVINCGFETPTVTNYVYQYPLASGSHTANFAATPGIGWKFSGAAGIDCNASKTFYAVNAPNGSQAAFIQGGGGAISQSINFPSTGSYQVSWYSIGRSGILGPNQLELVIDGNPIESFTPMQTVWTNYTSPGIYLTAGTHTVVFQGTATNDLSSCIDDVQIIGLQAGGIPTAPGMGDGAGTLILGSTGSINNSSAISIAAGATLDVSAIASYVLSSNTTLIASGAGTSTSSTAATINGASGGTVSLGSQPISLVFSPTTVTGDTTHPALYISQGTLSLRGNVFTVNNASSTALGAGTYLLIQQVSGSITSSGSNSVSVTGSGLAGADMASIQVSGGNVNLVVTAPPTIQTVTESGGSITFTWSTITNRTYQIQSTTNLAPAGWVNLSSVVTATNSTMTRSEPVGANSQRFYRVVLLP